MRNFDLTPLYRATVGFDKIADMMDRALAQDLGGSTYPPYNIEKTADDAYCISIAVAGFADDDLSVELRDGALIVTGRKEKDTADRTYLHRGIATRNFERRFQLADHVKVTGASHADGMLHITLEREIPERLRPRQIAITKAPKSAAKDVVDAQAVN